MRDSLEQGRHGHSAAELAVVARVSRRLMWFLFVASIAMSLDRTNIGFAALQMNKALGLSAMAFGAAITTFSAGYILFEIPSNMMFDRLGARIWLPRIMITWGIASTATMFATGPGSLYALRFLLGAAEGGFLPGVLLYLSLWFPEYQRARAMSMFLMAQAVAFSVAPLVSGPLLDMNGIWGLQGWQWLYLLEGLPSVALGVFGIFYLTARPASANWLSANEKGTLQALIDRQETVKRPALARIGSELRSPRLVVLAITYLGLPISLATYAAFAPSIVRALMPHADFAAVGLINAIPAGCTVLFMPYWSRRSDRRQERRWHVVVPMIIAAFGWLLVIAPVSAVVRMAGLTLAITGTFAAQGIFFTFVAGRLSARARPVGIAIVSATGVAGAALSPPLTGFFKDLTGSYAIGVWVVIAFLCCAAVLVLAQREQVPSDEEALEPGTA